jgi:hypothetical protein
MVTALVDQELVAHDFTSNWLTVSRPVLHE